MIRIMNAGAVRKETVSVPYSNLKHAIAETLVSAGYLKSATKRGKKVKKMLDVELLYAEQADGHVQQDAHIIRGVKRISKPGRRMYVGTEDIHPIKFGTGTLILSTPVGVVTGEEARKRRVGGEQLFMIW